MNNSLIKTTTKKQTFSNYITADGVKNKINSIIGSDKTNNFITSVVSAVNKNPELINCDPGTIVSAALEGQSIGMSASPVMGQMFLVPFNDTKHNRKVAQFQIGYKGYIQLAIRSNMYRDIDVIEVREGEYCGRNSETGKYMFSFIADEDERLKKEVIGYMAYFELLSGFKKTLYWSKAKMKSHAITYSFGYRNDQRKGTDWTFWSKNFDEMAYKTMLRQLISKWGVMSVELQKALEYDQSVIENGTPNYVDTNEFLEPEPEKLESQVEGELTNEEAEKHIKEKAEERKTKTKAKEEEKAETETEKKLTNEEFLKMLNKE